MLHLRTIQMVMYPEYYLTPFQWALSHRQFLDIGELWKYDSDFLFKQSAISFLYQLCLSNYHVVG